MKKFSTSVQAISYKSHIMLRREDPEKLEDMFAILMMPGMTDRQGHDGN